MFARYNSYSPYDIKESIRKEVKGDLEKSFLTLGNDVRFSRTFTYTEFNKINVVEICAVTLSLSLSL